MAVKGSATVTLTQYRDTQSVTRYYKLRPAGSSAPLKPETKPPSSDWTDSEPDCDISKELYFCDLTIFSNGQWEYSKVSKSSSYEAAKEAYNRANAAKDSIDNLRIGGRNLILKSNTAVNSTSYLIKEYTLSEDWNSDLLNNRGYILTLKGSINDGQKFGVWLNGPSNNVGYMTYDSEKDLYYLKPYLPTSTPVTEEYKRTIRFYNYPSGTATNATIEWIKLEKGNKATDWTPAPEDVDAGIANVQTGVDSLNDSVYGVQTFEYILNGAIIPVYRREDSTYYYILNDEEVAVAEADLVHDSDGELASYRDGGIYDNLDKISSDIDSIGTKVDGFDARENAIYKEIQDNSLIARKNARVTENSLIITNDTTGEAANLLNYLQLNPTSIVIYGNGKDIVTIAKTKDDSGYMEMKGTSLFIAQESRLSTIRLRSAEKIGKLALVAGSDGHVSLKEVLN